ncbi:MAG: SGNH/GDSL hydrolase family protein [Hyphomicrobiaceae bacterium]|nr:SGNH/GDSL hydrolase family protein [Hyphomicrobiaceae bacterium]
MLGSNQGGGADGRPCATCTYWRRYAALAGAAVLAASLIPALFEPAVRPAAANAETKAATGATLTATAAIAALPGTGAGFSANASAGRPAGTAQRTRGGEDCEAPPGLLRLAGPAPSLRTAFDRFAPVRILALGSSSTAGTGASTVAHSYPERLERSLRASFPRLSIEVLNRGVGGELASDMLARLDRDVLAERPTLVIWQTGVNDALRGVPMAEFASVLIEGIGRIRSAGSDVILLDPQFFPRAATLSTYMAYGAAMRHVGRELGVPVFRRYELMRHLVDSAQFRTEDLLAPDRFHQNDVSYACLGETLADALSGLVAQQDVAHSGGGEPVDGGGGTRADLWR